MMDLMICDSFAARYSELARTIREDKSYEFLSTDKRLGNNLIMLGLGGSYAYGTSNAGSDIDVRGVAMNSTDEIYLGRDFEQITSDVTDTTIYSVKKLFRLLTAANPNTIEILGLSDDQIIYTTPVWEKIRGNRDMFLSKRVINAFGGYANAQLRRLETKSARATGQADRERYILGSIQSAATDFRARYARMDSDAIRLYTDTSDKEDYDTEIYIDAHLSHYPLRDFASLINDYHAVIRGYDKIGKRNQKAIEHGKLGKHMMHLVRLYYMCFDILEKGEINTYRADEHDELMAIRNGKYLNDDKSVKPEFKDLVDSLQARLEEDSSKTTLPDEPDTDRIDSLLCEILEERVRG